ncbi:MAG: diaminopimelate decarboxylase, partial [Flavobacteriaceae bacterium]
MKNSDLIDIAQEFGNPIYVYDSEKIKFQYERLTSAFKDIGNLRINYATKALSNLSVLKYMKLLGA